MRTTTSLDSRLWAVLWLGIAILAMPALLRFPADSFGTAGRMTLQADGNSLRWSIDGNSAASPVTTIRPELTPFFFLPVPVNSADEYLLTTLPGIGKGMARRIIEHRKSRGHINSAEEFMEIRGIGSKRYHALRDDISFQ